MVQSATSAVRSGPRVVVAGIDGASWDVMGPLLDEGRLPHIAALLERGVHCPLRSTVPPISPVAWATMMTGVNPGRHGVTGWADLVNRQVFSSGDVLAPSVWDLISRAGDSVGVFNIPMTYPARAVSGYLVAGEIGTVDYDARMFHPPELFAEARERVPDYSLPAAEAERSRYGFDRLQANARTRHELLAHLLREHATDVVIAAVNYVDYAQHTRLVTRRSNGGEDVIAWAYEEADRFVGLLLEAAGKDAWVVLVSDHGAGPVEGYVNLPGLLRELGLLKVRRSSPVQQGLWRLRRLALKVRRLLPARGGRLLRRAGRSLRSQAYDWPRTTAYPVPASYAVALNSGERSGAPLVPADQTNRMAAEVAQAIEQVINPITGERDLATVLAHEQYHGPMASTAPDVLLEGRGGSYHMLTVGPDAPEVFLTPEQLAERYPALHKWEGMHRPEGVLAIAGPGAAPRLAHPDPTVMDIAPTILELAGIRVPEGVFDGRALVKSNAAPRRTLSAEEIAGRAQSAAEEHYSADEARRIEKRLEDLGYL